VIDKLDFFILSKHFGEVYPWRGKF
jgi:hypothetical protein